MTMRRARGRAGAIALAAVAFFAAATGPASAQQKRSLIVQSTTSVRDSGVLDQLITPQFRRRFPQYDLKFVAVGTGQAITNARAGQGDVLIGHSPAAERQFVRDGFSYERIGRTVMWNDFVIVGPANDPAGVLRRARTDAVGALEAIAAAGAAGRANFVSRGDKSGTNAKELEIWGLSRVARNAGSEPAAGSGNPAWYHKAGLGMADTLRLTQQCPFRGGGCYTITDRGTLQQLTHNRAITRLRPVMDDQAARGAGWRQPDAQRLQRLRGQPAQVPLRQPPGGAGVHGLPDLAVLPIGARPVPVVAAPGVLPRRVPEGRAVATPGVAHRVRRDPGHVQRDDRLGRARRRPAHRPVGAPRAAADPGDAGRCSTARGLTRAGGSRSARA